MRTHTLHSAWKPCTYIDTEVKVEQSRYTPWRRLGGEELQLLLILDLGNRWGWAVSVTPRPRFTPGERTSGTHCTGVWVGLRAGLDTKARGKILSPLPGIESRSSGRPVRNQTLYWLSYSGPCYTSTKYILSVQYRILYNEQLTLVISVLSENCALRMKEKSTVRRRLLKNKCLSKQVIKQHTKVKIVTEVHVYSRPPLTALPWQQLHYHIRPKIPYQQMITIPC
jgi:hypothetical protein